MNDATLLHRQIHPNFVQEGFASSYAFRPNVSDKGRMSVYDGDQIAPDRAWIHFTTVVKLKSAGTMTLAVAECTIESLTVRPDPESFPEHAVVDFTGIEVGRWRAVSKSLQDKARKRGWTYRPTDRNP